MKIAVSAFVPVAAFVFLAFFYDCHLFYYEQMQIFQFTLQYLLDSVSTAGGAGFYIARFLTQFFAVPVIGAALVALLLYLIALLVRKLADSAGVFSDALCNLPSLAVLLLFCDKLLFGVTLAMPVCLAISLAMALVVRRLDAGVPGSASALLVVALTYFLAGPMSIVTVLLFRPVRSWGETAAALTVFAACVAVAYLTGSQELHITLFGANYMIDFSHNPLLLWIPAVIAVAVVLCRGVIAGVRGGFPDVCAAAVLALAVVSGLMGCSDIRMENVMRCDRLMRCEDWQGIVDNAAKNTPHCYEEVSTLFLALGMQGRLPEYIFSYPNAGSVSMMPPFLPKSISPNYAAEVYYRLGFYSVAQRLTFEAQVPGNSSNNNVRCLKRLAELNAIQGNRAVAQKYLDKLSSTLFYGKWARNFDFDSPEISAMASKSLADTNFFHDVEMPAADELAILLKEHPDNSMARDYMLCSYLLDKNVDAFVKKFDPTIYDRIPRAYQEAYIVGWIQTHDDFSGMPDGFDQQYRKAMLDFANARREGKSGDYMRKHFRNTFWYHLFYRKEK